MRPPKISGRRRVNSVRGRGILFAAGGDCSREGQASKPSRPVEIVQRKRDRSRERTLTSSKKAALASIFCGTRRWYADNDLVVQKAIFYGVFDDSIVQARESLPLRQRLPERRTKSVNTPARPSGASTWKARLTVCINANNNRAMDRDCFLDIGKKSFAMCRDVRSAASCFVVAPHVGRIESARSGRAITICAVQPKRSAEAPSCLIE